MLPRVSLLLLLALAGCRAQAAPEAPRRPALTAALATAFDPAQTGTLAGRVCWEGEVPSLPPLRFFATPTLASSTHASPHQPQVDPETRGLAQAVVFLREVDPMRARPWPHGPVRIEHERRELLAYQDEQCTRTGFVRRGSAIEVVNGDTDFHCLRGRGAAFFALPLPDRGVVSRHCLDQAGVVSLSSAAGFYWMSAHLFVADHPYFTRTDEEGRFVLEQVPAGTYELVCWLPSWVSLGHERDPETGLVSRLVLAPPVEQSQQVQVEAGRQRECVFTWSRRRVEK